MPALDSPPNCSRKIDRATLAGLSIQCLSWIRSWCLETANRAAPVDFRLLEVCFPLIQAPFNGTI